MIAVAVPRPGTIEIVDIPQPTPGPYEALVRNQAACLCNATDRKLVEGRFPGIGNDQYPLLLGHESAGVVETVGSKVTSFRPGDRVIGALLLRPPDPAYHSGWGGFCEYLIATDHTAMTADGVADTEHGWLEVFQVMTTVPSDIPLEAAVLLCTWREVLGAFSDFRLQAGDDLLIFGAGPVGLSFARFARLLGLGWIGVVDPHAGKRARAIALGADEAFAPDTGVLDELTRRRGKPLDAVVDAVGRPELVNRALPLVRQGGTIGVYGVIAEPTFTVEKHRGPHNFNLYVHQWPTRAAERAAQPPLVDWIRAGRVRAADFVTAVYPVHRAAEAQRATSAADAIKTLLRYPS